MDDTASSRGSNRAKKISAGLFDEPTCRQLSISIRRWISPILFATKTDHLRDGEGIEFKIIVESDHRKICVFAKSKVSPILSIKRASSKAADSLSRGKETALWG